MEQTVSTALIVAIIAVVLGALGLIGGVIGYVQGTAALRRATLTRQRAAAAEEAALQARTQAEQAARTAQSVLDRLTGLNGAAGVADLPTGPLVLPHRSPVDSAPLVAPTPSPEASDESRGGSMPEPEVRSSFARPRTGPVETSSLTPEPDEADAWADLTTTPEAVALPPDVTPTPTPTRTPGTGADPIAFVPFGGLSPRQISSPGTAEPAPEAVEPTPAAADADGSDSTAPVSSEPEPSEPLAVAAPGPIAGEAGVPDEPPATTPTPEPTPTPMPMPTPEPAPAEVEPPQRSSTGQVTAGGQAPPPLDWAEALRTGAIPLPTRSRGTYSAPSKAKGQPVGPARFEIRAVGRQRYEAVNVGGATAEQASLEGAGDDSHLVRPVEARPKPVRSGESLAFSVLRVEGRQVSVRIAWMLNGDEEQAELPVP